MSTRIPDPGAAMRKKPRRARFRATEAAIVRTGTRVLNRGRRTRGEGQARCTRPGNEQHALLPARLQQRFPLRENLVADLLRGLFLQAATAQVQLLAAAAAQDTLGAVGIAAVR